MAKHVRKRGGLHLSPRLREQEAALRPERPEPQPESGADRGARYHVAKTRLFAAVMAGISVSPGFCRCVRPIRIWSSGTWPAFRNFRGRR